MIDILNTTNKVVCNFFVGHFGSNVGITLSVIFSFLVGVLFTWALIMPFWCIMKLKSKEYEDEEE